MEELKTRSFRITDKTAETIKSIAEEIGGNQQQTIAKLIESYNFQKAKSMLKHKKEDVEKFELYCSVLNNMFLSLLEENEHITEAVHTKFEEMLKSKDLTIKNLQEELEGAKIVAQSYTNSHITAEKQAEDLKLEMEELQKKINTYDEIIKTKDTLIQTFNSKINELEHKISEMESKNSYAEKILNEYNQLEKNLESVQKEKLQEVENLKLKNERVLLQLEKEYNQNMQNLKDKHQEEIDEYQSKYLKLLEKFDSKIDKGI